MRLVQVRECDGQCCIDQPQFPVDGVCKFFADGKCRAMTDMTLLNGDDVDHFLLVCRRYPQFLRAGRDTENCCWRWIDGD